MNKRAKLTKIVNRKPLINCATFSEINNQRFNYYNICYKTTYQNFNHDRTYNNIQSTLRSSNHVQTHSSTSSLYCDFAHRHVRQHLASQALMSLSLFPFRYPNRRWVALTQAAGSSRWHDARERRARKLSYYNLRLVHATAVVLLSVFFFFIP